MRSLFVIFLFCLASLVGDEGTSNQQIAPDPVALEPTWWNYFLIDGEELIKRIGEEQKILSELLKQEAVKENEEFVGNIKKILASLQAYAKAKKESIKPPILAPVDEKYELQKVLEVATKERELEYKLRAEKKEQALQKARLTKLAQHIDTLMIGYLKLKAGDPNKLSVGLEMMALQAALALNQEELRLAEERIDAYQQDLNHVKETLDYALKHIDWSQSTMGNLDEALLQAEDKLKKAQQESIRAETASVGSFGETPSEQAKRFLLLQHATQMFVLETIGSVDVITIKIEKALLQFNTLSEQVKEEELPDQIKKWGDSLKEIRNSLNDWSSKTDQEQQRIMTSSFKTDADAKELDQIQRVRYREVQETLTALQKLDLKLFHASLLLRSLQDKLDQEQSGWLIKGRELYEAVTGCCSPIVSWVDTPLFKIGGVPLTPKSLLIALLILVLAHLFSKMVRFFLRHMAKKKSANVTPASIFILSRLLHYLILLIGFSLALSILGLDFSSIALILGALSVGIGFGLQTIVNNFFSSLILLFSRTVKVEDYVELDNGLFGQVVDINAQNTIIHTLDGIDIIVPNSQMISNRVINWTLKNGYKRLHIPFGVAYGTDKELVEKVVAEAAAKVPCTVHLPPKYDAPRVWLVNFGPSTLDFELVVWVNVYSKGHRGSHKASYNWEIETALKEHHIEIPYNQLDVRLIKDI